MNRKLLFIRAWRELNTSKKHGIARTLSACLKRQYHIISLIGKENYYPCLAEQHLF